MPRVTRETREITRQKLLEAAASEFAEHGLSGANINRVSTRAGYAKGTVYNYFCSKEALFFEVVHEACTRAVSNAHDDPRKSTGERLTALIASDMDWVRRYPDFSRVFLQMAFSTDPAMGPRVIDAAQPFLGEITRILEAGMRTGEVRDDVPAVELALWCAGLADLALVQHFASGGAWPTLEQIPQLVVRQFLEGARGAARES